MNAQVQESVPSDELLIEKMTQMSPRYRLLFKMWVYAMHSGNKQREAKIKRHIEARVARAKKVLAAMNEVAA